MSPSQASPPVLVGQRWRPRGQTLSWEVIAIGKSEEVGEFVEVRGPGTLTTTIKVAIELFGLEWDYREPRAENVKKALDRCMAAVMKAWEPGTHTPELLTAMLREELTANAGYLYSWMPPDFWTVEIEEMKAAMVGSVKVHGALTLLPTALSGARVEFTPQATGGFKVATGDLFIHAPSIEEGLIGLARLKLSKEAPSGAA